MEEKELTGNIIAAAIEVHRHLGPGLLESAYQSCFVYELLKRGLQVEEGLTLPLMYKTIQVHTAYRLDVLVENKIIVELKSVEALNDVHTAQLLTYLKASDKRIGLLINFNVILLKDGIKRLLARKGNYDVFNENKN